MLSQKRNHFLLQVTSVEFLKSQMFFVANLLIVRGPKLLTRIMIYINSQRKVKLFYLLYFTGAFVVRPDRVVLTSFSSFFSSSIFIFIIALYESETVHDAAWSFLLQFPYPFPNHPSRLIHAAYIPSIF